MMSSCRNKRSVFFLSPHIFLERVGWRAWLVTKASTRHVMSHLINQLQCIKKLHCNSWVSTSRWQSLHICKGIWRCQSICAEMARFRPTSIKNTNNIWRERKMTIQYLKSQPCQKVSCVSKVNVKTWTVWAPWWAGYKEDFIPNGPLAPLLLAPESQLSPDRSCKL